jgi:hypothetical protein
MITGRLGSCAYLDSFSVSGLNGPLRYLR